MAGAGRETRLHHFGVEFPQFSRGKNVELCAPFDDRDVRDKFFRALCWKNTFFSSFQVRVVLELLD